MAFSVTVFVAGSFVFAYIFMYAASAGASTSKASPPKIAGVPILPNLPSLPPPFWERRSGSNTPTPAKSRVNFLLLGIDQRDDERGVPTRSDTMINVSFDQMNKTASMISLPRDLWVEIPGYADNRINVANFLGDAYKYPGGGPALAMKTVEVNFGIPIDYYARIDFRGFEKVVDTLGGVDIEVDRAIVDNEYPTEDYGTMRIYIPAGKQHMNGKVALQYARSRHSENDFGRAQRQQKVLVAIKDRALQLDVIPKLPSLMGTLLQTVQTDIPASEFLRLAKLTKEVGSANISNLVIDDKYTTPFKGEGGADLLIPKKAEIRQAIGALMAHPVVREEAARIEVINGTNKTGLAGRTGDYLIGQGYDVVKVSTADRSDYKRTQILLIDDSKKATAKLLASVLKVESQDVISRPDLSGPPAASSGPQIRIILGENFELAS